MHKRNTNNMLREKRKHANYKPNRRLDAKSSRGMIYENEELRIRTININADVERGQSEIKSLKREREQLRREIWTLRDEYDKLENLLRSKGIDPEEFMNANNDHNGDEDEGDDNVSDYSECSCESCCDEEHRDEKVSSDNPATDKTDEILKGDTSAASSSKGETSQSTNNSSKTSIDEHNKRSGKERLNLNFDHLSIVSEENSEVNSIIQNEDSSIPINDLSAFLHNVDVLSPLNYLQTLNPPLAHFENLNYEQIGGSNVGVYDLEIRSGFGGSSFMSFFPDQNGNILALGGGRNAQQLNGSSNALSAKLSNTPPLPSPSEPVKKESRLKHFFSPIRKKTPIPVIPPVPPIISQPDVFISNVLPSNLYVGPTMRSQNMAPESSTKVGSVAGLSSPTSSFQTGGNLEELLFDIEALSKDIMDLQTQCTNSPTENDASNKKPYRSELNLVLSYPGQQTENEYQGSSDVSNLQTTPPIPAPMELLTPSSQTNPLLLQNFPSPNFPSAIPSSPITPPLNFKTVDGNLFEKVPDYSHINFVPINTPVSPIFSSNNSIFCTVSAPSTPASDRKCIDKFCVSETSSDNQQSIDKKKAKRVSIVNTKEDGSEKTSESQEAKDPEGKDQIQDINNPNHHSHMHRHSHSHIHPKRRMSLDNNLNSTRHKNHRQICNDPNANVQRRESKSSNSIKKRSRSDSTFGVHGDGDQGGTSMSERYSNSIASSRESSSSLSGKRRISINSYGGSKKIPWCGCWGNSCL